jgi:hypothetical protein
VFALILAAVRGELVQEAITEPSGSKPLNPLPAPQHAVITLSVFRCVSDLKQNADLADYGKKRSATGEYGFIESDPLNFAAFSTDLSGKAEEWKGTIPATERRLFKKRVLDHPDVAITAHAIAAIREFVNIVLSAAESSSDEKLFDLAVPAQFGFDQSRIPKTRDGENS